MFLVGGKTKSIYPQAIMLHSGDIVIMSGASRLAYHGVPKIITPIATNTTPIPLSRHYLVEYNIIQTSSDSITQPLCEQQAGSLQCQVCGDQRRQDSKRAVESNKHSTKLEQCECTQSQHEPTIDRDLNGTVLDRSSLSSTHLCEVLPAKRARLELHKEHGTPSCTNRDTTTLDRHHRFHDVLHHNLFEHWSDFERYISTSRININIRQVNSRQSHDGCLRI